MRLTAAFPGQPAALGSPFSPQLTCLTVGAALWASVVLCLRPSCRSRGVMGRGKQLVGFLDYWEEADRQTSARGLHIQSQVSRVRGPMNQLVPSAVPLTPPPRARSLPFNLLFKRGALTWQAVS